MTISKQGQSASDNSTAIQAARDVNYHAGMGSEQVVEMMKSFQGLIQNYAEQSQQTIDARFDSFRAAIIEDFFEKGLGKPEAFADPDFQGALFDAQKAHARSGDQDLEGVLVDLVSQKSRCKARDRKSLTINAAIETAAYLTAEDFDQLALIFLFKSMRGTGVMNLRDLAKFLKIFYEPVTKAVKTDDDATDYLISQGCLHPLGALAGGRQDAFQILCSVYPGICSKGVAHQKLSEIMKEVNATVMSIVVTSQLDKDCAILDPGVAEFIDKIFANSGLSARPGDEYIALARANPMQREEFIALVEPMFGGVRQVLDKYDSKVKSGAELTPLGKALAYARMRNIKEFDAPLEIWIK